VRLEEVVVTGSGAARDASSSIHIRGGNSIAAPATAPAPEAKKEQFEMAKAAAAQRAATTLSAVDSVSADFKDTSVRRIGTRTFALANGMWTDTRYVKTMQTVRVKPYSAAYFALLERFDDLRAAFALAGADASPGVVVAGRRIAVAVASDGVDALDARELTGIEAGW
jgi:hypothetical protein